MRKKVKVISAKEAIEKYNKLKELYILLTEKLSEKNEKIKETNLKLDEAIKKYADTKKELKRIRKVAGTVWVMSYLEGE